MKLVIATKNKNKLKEIKDKFAAIENLELLSLLEFNNPPTIIEDGSTFEENALKKAEETSLFTGLPAMADDSGLVVDALGGRPGVLSARYGGDGSTDEEKNRLLLQEMADIPAEKRGARFVCVIALAMPDGGQFTVEGICEGTITREMTGSNGFGYDPIFFLPGKGRTMAELKLSEKNKISHRAIALKKALELLRNIL